MQYGGLLICQVSVDGPRKKGFFPSPPALESQQVVRTCVNVCIPTKCFGAHSKCQFFLIEIHESSSERKICLLARTEMKQFFVLTEAFLFVRYSSGKHFFSHA